MMSSSSSDSDSVVVIISEIDYEIHRRYKKNFVCALVDGSGKKCKHIVTHNCSDGSTVTTHTLAAWRKCRFCGVQVRHISHGEDYASQRRYYFECESCEFWVEHTCTTGSGTPRIIPVVVPWVSVSCRLCSRSLPLESPVMTEVFRIMKSHGCTDDAVEGSYVLGAKAVAGRVQCEECEEIIQLQVRGCLECDDGTGALTLLCRVAKHYQCERCLTAWKHSSCRLEWEGSKKTNCINSWEIHRTKATARAINPTAAVIPKIQTKNIFREMQPMEEGEKESFAQKEDQIRGKQSHPTTTTKEETNYSSDERAMDCDKMSEVKMTEVPCRLSPMSDTTVRATAEHIRMEANSQMRNNVNVLSSSEEEETINAEEKNNPTDHHHHHHHQEKKETKSHESSMTKTEVPKEEVTTRISRTTTTTTTKALKRTKRSLTEEEEEGSTSRSRSRSSSPRTKSTKVMSTKTRAIKRGLETETEEEMTGTEEEEEEEERYLKYKTERVQSVKRDLYQRKQHLQQHQQQQQSRQEHARKKMKEETKKLKKHMEEPSRTKKAVKKKSQESNETDRRSASPETESGASPLKSAAEEQRPGPPRCAIPQRQFRTEATQPCQSREELSTASEATGTSRDNRQFSQPRTKEFPESSKMKRLTFRQRREATTNSEEEEEDSQRKDLYSKKDSQSEINSKKRKKKTKSAEALSTAEDRLETKLVNREKRKKKKRSASGDRERRHQQAKKEQKEEVNACQTAKSTTTSEKRVSLPEEKGKNKTSGDFEQQKAEEILKKKKIHQKTLNTNQTHSRSNPKVISNSSDGHQVKKTSPKLRRRSSSGGSSSSSSSTNNTNTKNKNTSTNNEPVTEKGHSIRPHQSTHPRYPSAPTEVHVHESVRQSVCQEEAEVTSPTKLQVVHPHAQRLPPLANPKQDIQKEPPYHPEVSHQEVMQHQNHQQHQHQHQHQHQQEVMQYHHRPPPPPPPPLEQMTTGQTEMLREDHLPSRQYARTMDPYQRELSRKRDSYRPLSDPNLNEMYLAHHPDQEMFRHPASYATPWNDRFHHDRRMESYGPQFLPVDFHQHHLQRQQPANWDFHQRRSPTPPPSQTHPPPSRQKEDLYMQSENSEKKERESRRDTRKSRMWRRHSHSPSVAPGEEKKRRPSPTGRGRRRPFPFRGPPTLPPSRNARHATQKVNEDDHLRRASEEIDSLREIALEHCRKMEDCMEKINRIAHTCHDLMRRWRHQVVESNARVSPSIYPDPEISKKIFGELGTSSCDEEESPAEKKKKKKDPVDVVPQLPMPLHKVALLTNPTVVEKTATETSMFTSDNRNTSQTVNKRFVTKYFFEKEAEEDDLSPPAVKKTKESTKPKNVTVGVVWPDVEEEECEEEYEEEDEEEEEEEERKKERTKKIVQLVDESTTEGKVSCKRTDRNKSDLLKQKKKSKKEGTEEVVLLEEEEAEDEGAEEEEETSQMENDEDFEPSKSTLKIRKECELSNNRDFKSWSVEFSHGKNRESLKKKILGLSRKIKNKTCDQERPDFGQQALTDASYLKGTANALLNHSFKCVKCEFEAIHSCAIVSHVVTEVNHLVFETFDPNLDDPVRKCHNCGGKVVHWQCYPKSKELMQGIGSMTLRCPVDPNKCKSTVTHAIHPSCRDCCGTFVKRDNYAVCLCGGIAIHHVCQMLRGIYLQKKPVSVLPGKDANVSKRINKTCAVRDAETFNDS